MNKVITEAIRIVAAAEATEDDAKSELLGSNPQHYDRKSNGGKLTKTAMLHMLLTPYIPDRKERMQFLQHLFDREIKSTKDIKIAEFWTINRAGSTQLLPRAVEEWRERQKSVTKPSVEISELQPIPRGS